MKHRLVVLTLWALACSPAPEPDMPPAEESPPSPPTPVATTLEDAHAQILREIGEARASVVGQCAIMPLGVRPCGGPREYLAYSVAETDSASLAALVAIHDQLDQERNEREGLVSTCELMMPPEVGLESGRCVTRVPGAPN